MESGATSCTPFAYYDHAYSSWRTWPPSGGDTADCTEYSQTWPPQGMTRAGAAYAPPTSAHPTAGNDCSCSPGTDKLLPTPQAHDGSSNGISAASRQGGPSLLDALRLLPTPKASDGAKSPPDQRGSKRDPTLPSDAIAVTRNPRDAPAPARRRRRTTTPPLPTGATTHLRSATGRRPPEDRHRNRHSPAETATQSSPPRSSST